jgi:hypothetical protein
VIYSVVPEELAPELYEKLVEYYKDDPNVKVIIDRRKSERRGRAAADPSEQRERRDRRRSRVPGEFPQLDADTVQPDRR